ncbi:MAG: hypothetical protein WAO08_19295 [Hyphomicrobiaceae bacterium]
MGANATIARPTQRTSGPVTDRLTNALAVWRNPGETEREAIERYMREHPELAAIPEAALTIHVLSWEN